MMEVNVIAYNDDKIMSSYVVDGIQERDVVDKFPKKTNGVYEIVGDKLFLKELYTLMTNHVTASERYDVRIKRSVVERALAEKHNDFMDNVLKWKDEMRYKPRDVMSEYKFLSECQTIDNLISFFEDNAGCDFGILFHRIN